MIALLGPVIALAHSLLLVLAAPLPGPPGLQLLLALVLLTLAVRSLLIPLSLHGFRKRQSLTALAPALERVRRKHADSPERLAGGLATVYRDAGVTPLAGMGTTLLMSPVMVMLYGLSTSAQLGGTTNALVASQLLGTPLSAHLIPALLTAQLSAAGLVLLAVLATLALIAWWSGRGTTEGPGWLRLLPFSTVVIAAVSPIALSAYLVTTTAWTVAERAAFTRWG